MEFVAEATAQAIEKGTTALLRVTTDKGAWEGDLVLLAIGVKPDVRLAKSLGLSIGKTGAISVNFAQQTSLENVYAVGDCFESFLESAAAG